MYATVYVCWLHELEMSTSLWLKQVNILVLC